LINDISFKINMVTARKCLALCSDLRESFLNENQSRRGVNQCLKLFCIPQFNRAMARWHLQKKLKDVNFNQNQKKNCQSYYLTSQICKVCWSKTFGSFIKFCVISYFSSTIFKNLHLSLLASIICNFLSNFYVSWKSLEIWNLTSTRHSEARLLKSLKIN